MRNPKCPFTPEDLQEQGSRWILANFHTHTPGSLDYAKDLVPGRKHSSKDVARGILEDCRREGVHVLAVTDHNSPSFARATSGNGGFAVDPEKESYYAMMRDIVREEPEQYGGILVLPGVEIGAENIHVLGFFAPSDDPGWDAVRIAAILEEGNCPPEFYGDHKRSCTDFSVADAIDVIHEHGGIAIPAHIDGPSGFLEEEDQARLLKLIVSRPHLFAVEYVKDAARKNLEELINSTSGRDILAAREGRAIAWTKSSDAHFVRAFNRKQDGNGEPIGTEGRRTWLRLDPGALTFEAVRAALLDPENRVRVDSTRRPHGRQGAYQPPPPDRTSVRAIRLDWGRRHAEVVRFNEGINAFVGPPRAGKTARAQAFSAATGKKEELNAVDLEQCDCEQNGGSTLRAVDMILQRRFGDNEKALWWLHREDRDRIFAARVEVAGDRLRIHRGAPGQWVNLFSNGRFNRHALRDYFQDLPPAQERLDPAIPQAFSLAGMRDMLHDPVRLARFIEWHYVPDELRAHHRKLHAELRHATQKQRRGRGRKDEIALAKKLEELFMALREPRRKAKAVLRALNKNSKLRLTVAWERGKWTRATERKRVARELLAMAPAEPGAAFDVLKSIEDRARLGLESASGHPPAPGTRVADAVEGLLLVIGARHVGPVIFDAPEAYFQPTELTETLGPLILEARDSGTQFIASLDDTNFPFAVDADLLLICRRDGRDGHVAPLNMEASGSLESAVTSGWALKNLDGGGDQFSRRLQLYLPVLGADLAERQRKLAKVVLALGDPRGRRTQGRGK